MKAPNTKERNNFNYDDYPDPDDIRPDFQYITMLVIIINSLEAESNNYFCTWARIYEEKLFFLACWLWSTSKSEEKPKTLEKLNTAIADGGWEGWKFEFIEKSKYHSLASIVKA